MSEAKFLTRKEAQEAGWFSRRHETGEENRKARERYQWLHGKEARRRRTQERAR